MRIDATARRELVTAAALAVVTIVYGIQTLSLPHSGATRADVGPKTYPLMLVVLLAGTTIVLGVQGIRHLRGAAEAPAERREGARPRWGRLAGLVVASAVYLRVMSPLGFLIATALYLAVALLAVDGLGRYRGARLVLTPLGFGVVTSIGIYALFDGALGVLLPTGLFGWEF